MFENEQCALVKTTTNRNNKEISVETLQLFYPSPKLILQEDASIRQLLSLIRRQTSTPKELCLKIIGGFYTSNNIQLGGKERELFKAWQNLLDVLKPSEVPQPSNYFMETHVSVNGISFKTLRLGGLHGENLKAKEVREWIKPENMSNYLSKRGWTKDVGLPGLNAMSIELWDKTVQEIHTHAIGTLGTLVSCWNEAHWTEKHGGLNQQLLTKEQREISEMRLMILGWNTDEIIQRFPMTVRANEILIRQELLQIYVDKTEIKKEFRQDGIHFGGKKGEKHRIS